MNHFDVTYLYHSGFTVACEDILLVFDYWQGENGELPQECELTPRILKQYRQVYVFVSHEHPDHYDPVIWKWRTAGDVNYIVSSDFEQEIPAGVLKMRAGQSVSFNNRVQVKAFPSTDMGVSFLVTLDGFHIFHAGDLNFWHWCAESTPKQIDEAEADFHAAVKPIIGERIDLAFFPVDPRQGNMYDAGANYFLITVKPRLLIPMHCWGRMDMASDFARRSRSPESEIIVMEWCGEIFNIDVDDNGAMMVTLPEAGNPMSKVDMTIENIDENSPFYGSDLPINMDDE